MSSSEPPNQAASTTAYRYLIGAGLFMVLGISLLVFLGREEARVRQMELAELDLQPLLYTETPLTEQSRAGKVVVLYFWGFWNAPSREPYPDFVELQKEFRDNPECLVISVACPQNDQVTIDQVAFHTKKYIDRLRYDEMPIYTDIYQFSRTQVSRLFSSGGFQYPTTIVLNRDGKVEGAWRGSLKIKEVRDAIKSALATPASEK
ncbi:TlpA family protein disulfide reductase [Pirellulaceae bacterium SH449]